LDSPTGINDAGYRKHAPKAQQLSLAWGNAPGSVKQKASALKARFHFPRRLNRAFSAAS
jgi:hypothetical protein